MGIATKIKTIISKINVLFKYHILIIWRHLGFFAGAPWFYDLFSKYFPKNGISMHKVINLARV